MASKLGLQNRPPFLGFLEIPHLPEPVIQLSTFHTELLTAGLATNHKPTLETYTNPKRLMR